MKLGFCSFNYTCQQMLPACCESSPSLITGRRCTGQPRRCWMACSDSPSTAGKVIGRGGEASSLQLLKQYMNSLKDAVGEFKVGIRCWLILMFSYTC
ncbi:hypothetical protein Nepgr_016673 [Nepenthes gracilis]|uniref:Uncharacterized protein n=1 Tax=Nepenthes gracilis TaxID=150966 RepID=A0AAD3XRI5_NEPGR|nr:hypothetical protein Nepgr_016673 [Nepenthes gracilis]